MVNFRESLIKLYVHYGANDLFYLPGVRHKSKIKREGFKSAAKVREGGHIWIGDFKKTKLGIIG
jgi:hypothetical protein